APQKAVTLICRHRPVTPRFLKATTVMMPSWWPPIAMLPVMRAVLSTFPAPASLPLLGSLIVSVGQLIRAYKCLRFPPLLLAIVLHQTRTVSRQRAGPKTFYLLPPSMLKVLHQSIHTHLTIQMASLGPLARETH